MFFLCSDIRDTSNFRPLTKLISGKRTPSLKTLARIVLGHRIHDGEHCSVEDARVAMQIYNKWSNEWETLVRRKMAHHQKYQQQQQQESQQQHQRNQQQQLR